MPEIHGDDGELFARHHARLLAIWRAVRTDRANVEDACSIAWLRVLGEPIGPQEKGHAPRQQAWSAPWRRMSRSS